MVLPLWSPEVSSRLAHTISTAPIPCIRPSAAEVADEVSVSASSTTVVSPKAMPSVVAVMDPGPLMTLTAVGFVPDTMSCMKKLRCVVALSSAVAAVAMAARRARRRTV
nr:unnamed protein product [Digitaria exilis]